MSKVKGHQVHLATGQCLKLDPTTVGHRPKFKGPGCHTKKSIKPFILDFQGL